MSADRAQPPSHVENADAPSGGTWDEAKAEWLIGKYALVGVAWIDKSGARQEQYHGRIVAAERDVGISIACEGYWLGETFVIPPAIECVVPASRGEYKLRATGETVVDPDVLSTWRIDSSAAPEPN